MRFIARDSKQREQTQVCRRLSARADAARGRRKQSAHPALDQSELDQSRAMRGGKHRFAHETVPHDEAQRRHFVRRQIAGIRNAVQGGLAWLEPLYATSRANARQFAPRWRSARLPPRIGGFLNEVTFRWDPMPQPKSPSDKLCRTRADNVSFAEAESENALHELLSLSALPKRLDRYVGRNVRR